MDRPLFYAEDNTVHWSPDHRRSVRLRERDVEAILDIFQDAEAAQLFNQLYAAHLAAGGIMRVSSLIQESAALAARVA